MKKLSIANLFRKTMLCSQLFLTALALAACTSDDDDKIQGSDSLDPMTRVSVATSGDLANDDSTDPMASEDGRYIVFQSVADNLVANDTNMSTDIFLRDTSNNTTIRVSVSDSGLGNAEANGDSGAASISANGQYIVFLSSATNLVSGDSTPSSDLYIRDVVNQTTTQLIDTAGFSQGGINSPEISANGKFVVFNSNADNLVANVIDTNGTYDVFVYDIDNGTISLVSVDSNENQGNAMSFGAAISENGRYVAFTSDADNLVGNDSNGFNDVFVRDIQAGETFRVSVNQLGEETNGGCSGVRISADGRFVSFSSSATNLVDLNNDQIFNDVDNGFSDIYRTDWVNGDIELVSIGVNGELSNADNFNEAISRTGRYVQFESQADNLTDGLNIAASALVRDMEMGVTRMVNKNVAGTGTSNNDAEGSSMSLDGRYVVFESTATDLLPDTVDTTRHIYKAPNE